MTRPNLLRDSGSAPATIAAGYASREYADSLTEFGAVIELPTCGGWLLESQISDTHYFDGMGCYPLFSCRDWNCLGSDIDALTDRLVTIRLVTDPFADVEPCQLERFFPDACYTYKQHFVTNLTQSLDTTVSSHHLRNVRKAQRCLDVRQTSPLEAIQTWPALYENLVRRHSIEGIAQFSADSFERQFRVPGVIVFSARVKHSVCGMVIWFVQGDVAYYHLAAYSDQGYDCSASFALFWESLRYFAVAGIRWAALGAGAGTTAQESGLTRFKRGWATETRPVYFCGRILQPATYEKLSARVSTSTSYFPAYRAGLPNLAG